MKSIAQQIDGADSLQSRLITALYRKMIKLIIDNHQHIGLILVLIGTLCLAFSIKTEEEPNEMKRSFERSNPHLKFWYSTRVTIIKPLFWIGIILVMIGTAFQW